MSFPAYPQYKESGVEWLGEVPEHWSVQPLKRAIEKVESGTSVNAADYPAEDGALGVLKTSCVYTGRFDWTENKTVDESDLQRVSCPLRLNTLIVSRMNTPELVGATGLVEFAPDGVFLPDRLWQVYFDRKSSPAFFYYFTKSSEYRGQVKIACSGTSASMQNLGQEDFGSLLLAKPPVSEQTQIARFLDHETTRIDALIEEQQRLIELLKEKRQAVISHAVTKGLDPTVPMKYSGVEWLGEVPAHWEFGKVRYFAKLESGHTPSRGKPEYWENCTVPWFSLADVWQIRKGEVEEVFETKELVSELGLANSSARLLPKGTVILSRTASVGYSAIMGCAMATTQDFANWICGEKLFNYYLLCCFRAMSSEFLKLMMGSTHKTIYMPDIAELVCPVPPLDEQEKIASFIRESSLKFGSLVAEAERMKELLAERRSALISAAVTGKIDVRGWQPPAGTPSPESAIAEAH